MKTGMRANACVFLKKYAVYRRYRKCSEIFSDNILVSIIFGLLIFPYVNMQIKSDIGSSYE